MALGKTFLVVAGVACAAYAIYEGKPKPRDGAAEGGGNVLVASHPAFYGTQEPGGPVLRMKPETVERLHKLTPSKVVMFATSWCPYCARAREVFREQGVRFSELNVETDHDAAALQKELFGSNGVPVVVVGNRVMAGFDQGELLRALKEL